MPSYSFICPVCNNPQRLIIPAKRLKDPIHCQWDGCKGILKRVPRSPSVQITETLDNGLMARRLERPAEAETIYNERAHGKKGII